MGNNKPEISVIVPAYNAEPFLHRCVDSIRSQTYSNLEIILVDDGSGDSTPAICDEYADKDKRIRVIHQKNGGLSEARNAGIELATSDYYVFIDADDEILPTMIEALWYVMQKTDADIAQCGLEMISTPEERAAVYVSETFSPDNLGEIHEISGDEKYSIIYNFKPYYWYAVVQWNKLYKKKIFETLRYPPGKYHEDEYVIHKQLMAADKFSYTNAPLYMYYKHNQSITSINSLKRKYDTVGAMLDRLIFFHEQGLDYEQESMTGFLSYARVTKEDKKTPDADIWKPKIDALFNYGVGYYIDNVERHSFSCILKDREMTSKEKGHNLKWLMLRAVRIRAEMLRNTLFNKCDDCFK